MRWVFVLKRLRLERTPRKTRDAARVVRFAGERRRNRGLTSVFPPTSETETGLRAACEKERLYTIGGEYLTIRLP